MRIVLAGLVIALAFPGAAGASNELSDAQAFTGFSIYFAGERANGAPLRDSEATGHGRAGAVVIEYGPCEAVVTYHPSCLQLVNNSMCRAHPARFDPALDTFPLNGAQAAWIESGVFEVYTGKVAVSFIAKNRAMGSRIARRLRAVRPRERTNTLRPPNKQLLHGEANCQRDVVATPQP